MQLDKINSDPARQRPFLDSEGKSWVSIKKGDFYEKSPSDIPAVLTLAQWREIDANTFRTFTIWAPLTYWLIQNNLVFDVPDGIAKTTLVEEHVPNSPAFSITHLPLPLVHHDTPPGIYDEDPDMPYRGPSASARRVAQKIESLLLLGFKDPGHNSAKGLLDCDEVSESRIQSMLQKLEDRKFYGPYALILPDISRFNGYDESLAEIELLQSKRLGFSSTPETPFRTKGSKFFFKLHPMSFVLCGDSIS